MEVDQLINNLSKEAGAKPALKPAVLFIRWLTLSVAYLTILVFFFGVRADLSEKIGATLFTYEILSLLAVMASVAISAIILSYPDMYQKRYLIYLPVIPVIAFIYIMYLSFQADNPPAPVPKEGLDCFICICLFSIGPALLLLGRLRKQATTHPRLTSGLAVLSSVTFGAVIFRFCEKTDSIEHIITSHYLPLLGFALIGVALGKKLLRW